jgi:hypothetical protein
MKTLSKILIAIALAGTIVPALRASTGAAIVGNTVTFSVTSDGTPPFTYQWKKGTATIIGATLQTYVIQSVNLTDAGVYTVQIANSAGSVLSDTATLTVSAPTLPPTQGTTSTTVTKAPGTLSKPQNPLP